MLLKPQDQLRAYTGNLPALDQLFRTGQTPSIPLQGRFKGEFLAFHVAPGLTSLAAWFDRTLRPWQGKTFLAERGEGYNLVRRKARPMFRLLFPAYNDYLHLDAETDGAFPFRTYVGVGRVDQDCQVLKIDYDVRANPHWIVRQVLDELVIFESNVYLGKAYFRWPWGTWQRWAYFMLY